MSESYPSFNFIELGEAMGKVLIFGIGGFVGRYLAQEFVNARYEVHGSDVNQPVTLLEGVGFTKVDLINAENVLRLVTDINPEMIINLAAISSVGLSWNIPQTTMMVNVVGALNVMEAARKQVLMPKVMFIGSSEEYEVSNKPISEETKLNANNPYGISKMTQEKFAELYREQYGMKVYCVRPFNHTGVGQRDSFVLPSFCKQVAEIEKSGRPGVIKIGNLAARRDFSHVKDIVRAYRLIIENDDICDQIYNVGSGKAYGLDEMLQFIIGLSNQNIKVEVDPARIRIVDTPVICCDRSLIGRKLGWEPEFSVFDALREMYEYYVKPGFPSIHD
jgi:GDP-4-dehydro-6-deoxy-D-mannose reductase